MDNESSGREAGRTTVRRTTRTVAVIAAAGTALAAGAIGLHSRADAGTPPVAATSGTAGTQSADPQSQDQFQGFGFGSNAPSQGSGPPAGRSGGS